jgi:hypothetical protein
VNLDLPATFLDLAGAPIPGDGASLVPLVLDPAAPWRGDVLIEHWDPTWAGLRARDAAGREWAYVEQLRKDARDPDDFFGYLFDLTNDPYEMQNLYGDPYYADVQADLGQRLAGRKGLAGTMGPRVPTARFGYAYQLQLTAWGGTPPYTWAIRSGRLPGGLTLDPTTGLVSGIAREVTTQEIEYEVTDSSVMRQAGRAQRYIGRQTIKVSAWDYDGDGHKDDVDNCPYVANPDQLDANGDGFGEACELTTPLHCGLGAELSLAVLALAGLRRRSRRRAAARGAGAAG